jgi:hypothetical protein
LCVAIATAVAVPVAISLLRQGVDGAGGAGGQQQEEGADGQHHDGRGVGTSQGIEKEKEIDRRSTSQEQETSKGKKTQIESLGIQLPRLVETRKREMGETEMERKEECRSGS